MLRDERRADLSGKAIARLKIHGERFEIISDPKLAFLFKRGEPQETPIEIKDILTIDEIFSNASKGERASREKLIEIFETDDPLIIAEIILKRGELQLSSEQRAELSEKKRKQIVNFLSRNCIDPRNRIPHPPIRIENAMKQTKVSIDPFEPIEAQARDIVKTLRTVLPISMEQVKLAARIPAEFTGKVYGVVKRFSEILQEEWASDGSWIAVVSLSAGLQGDLLEQVGEICKGRAEFKVIEKVRV